MNERIKELAEQAGIAVWGDAVYMYDPKDTLDSTVMKKFAELIVKECVSIAKMTEPSDSDDYRSGRYWAGVDIKKHFGVEE